MELNVTVISKEDGKAKEYLVQIPETKRLILRGVLKGTIDFLKKVLELLD